MIGLFFADKYELLICRWPVFVCNLAELSQNTHNECVKEQRLIGNKISKFQNVSVTFLQQKQFFFPEMSKAYF